jgi:methyl-accepting chemotaxis protein
MIKTAKITNTIAIFSLLMLVLIGLIGSLGLINIKSLGDNINYITRETTPAVIKGGELVAQVQRINLMVVEYRFQTDRSRLAELSDSYTKLSEDLREILKNTPTPDKRLEKLKTELIQQFEQVDLSVNEILPAHVLRLDAADAVKIEKDLILFQISELDKFLTDVQSDIEYVQDARGALAISAVDNGYNYLSSKSGDAVKMLEKIEKANLLDAKVIKKTSKEMGRLGKKILKGNAMLERGGKEKDGTTTPGFDRLYQQMGESNYGSVATLADRLNSNLFYTLQYSYIDNLNKETTLQAQISTMTVEFADVVDQFVAVANELAEQAETESLVAVESSMINIIIVSLFSFMLATVVAFALRSAIVGPTKRLLESISKVAEGDLTTVVDVDRGAEFIILAERVNQMIMKQREVLAAIANGAGKLSETTVESLDISERTMKSMEDQQEQTHMAATAMTELGATADEVAQNAEGSLNVLDSMSGQVESTRSAVESNRSSVEDLSNLISVVGDKFTQVNEESSHIAGVLDIIRGIAEKTNLLALNAAIEAARAGEHGRGFAVVADEVRSLAAHSQKSTQDINEIIERLNSSIEEAIPVMELSSERVEQTVESSNQTEAALNQVLASFTQIRDQSTSIASAATEQSAVVNEITSSINKIADVASETSESAHKGQEIASSLSVLSDEQQALLTRFKL